MITERKSNGTLLWMRTLDYDADGRITKILTTPKQTSADASAANAGDTAEYDTDNRLASWNGAPCSFDPDGNLLTGPNAHGTAAATYQYDAHNRLTGVNNQPLCTYSPDGHRTGSNGAKYVIDPNASLSRVLMRTANGATTYYIWGANGLEYETDANGTYTKTYHADHLGSTMLLTDGNGNPTGEYFEYDSYGTPTYTAGNPTTPFRFHGALGCITDDNGLVSMRARFYNPRIMRFLNQDPIGFAGGLNHFAAFDNNPITNVDPSGLIPIDQPPPLPPMQGSFSINVSGPSIMFFGTGFKIQYFGGGYTGRIYGFDSPLGYQSGPVWEGSGRYAWQILGLSIYEKNFTEQVIWTRDYARRFTSGNGKWFSDFEATVTSGASISGKGGNAGFGSFGLSITKDGIGGTFSVFSLGIGSGPASLFGVSGDLNIVPKPQPQSPAQPQSPSQFKPLQFQPPLQFLQPQENTQYINCFKGIK
jgi:RHS repeat-associated protein